MTKGEFELGYAQRSGFTWERLRELGGGGVPCTWGEEGWQMVFSSGRVVGQAPSVEEAST